MNQDERRSLLATQLDRATTAGSLARAALLVAMAEEPELDARACMTRLAGLSERVRLVVEETGQLPWRALAQVLGEEEGFRGDFDEYDAPSNSFLHQVLDTRRGLPILLSILWVEVARGAGIRADGVGLPGHFVAVVGEGDRQTLIDPFGGGRPLARDEALHRASMAVGTPGRVDPTWLEPVPARNTILRVLANLANSYERRGDTARLLRTVGDQCRLDPENPIHFLRRGETYGTLGERKAALADLNLVLATTPAGPIFDRAFTRARHLARVTELDN